MRVLGWIGLVVLAVTVAVVVYVVLVGLGK
jgi:hypothetical protein